jgi:F-type H+-transporting ATPase subunit a
MNLTELLTHEIEPHVLFTFQILGMKIHIMDTIFVMWLVMAFLIIASLVLTRKMKLVPEGKQNFVETIVEFVNNMTKDAIGHHWRHFAPYIGTVLLFLAVSNIISVFNIIPSAEDLHKMTHLEIFEHMPSLLLKPPTKDINVPASLAIMSVLLMLFAGIRFKTMKGWLRNFIEPVPFVLPFKILEYGIIPLSLCLRLFGNILAGYMIMELVYVGIKQFLPAAFAPGLLSIYFDLFDGLLQAYVFVFLTSLYVGEAVE